MVKKRIRALNTRFNLPTVRGNKQMLRYVVWGTFMMILLLSLLSILKYSVMSSRLYSVEQELNYMRTKTKADAPVNPRLMLYMNAFIPLYIHVAPESEHISKRARELAKYFASNLKDTTTASHATKRILKKAILFEVKDSVASYIVEYTNVVFKKKFKRVAQKDAGNAIAGVKEYETKSEHVVKSLLHIPYMEEKGRYCVTGLPYFTAIPELRANLSLPEGYLPTSTSNVDMKTNEEVRSFVDDFLKKYTTQTANDLSYMMREPESIRGLYEYVTSTKTATQEGERIIVHVEMQLKEKSVSIQHVERIKLVLVKKDNKYVVEKLVYQGGK